MSNEIVDIQSQGRLDTERVGLFCKLMRMLTYSKHVQAGSILPEVTVFVCDLNKKMNKNSVVAITPPHQADYG